MCGVEGARDHQSKSRRSMKPATLSTFSYEAMGAASVVRGCCRESGPNDGCQLIRVDHHLVLGDEFGHRSR